MCDSILRVSSSIRRIDLRRRIRNEQKLSERTGEKVIPRINYHIDAESNEHIKKTIFMYAESRRKITCSSQYGCIYV